MTVPALPSRLPTVGTTIFTVMSRLANEHGAINLSQGFPDFSPPAHLLERVTHHMQAGANQYPPMAGVAPLRAAIAEKVERLYGARYDIESEITVTAGATQALFTAIAACVRPGDEVIVFAPVYDSYIPALTLQGGSVRVINLQPPAFRPDWAAVAAAVTPRTRMIILNTPHNPTGTVWTADDMAALARLVRGTDIVLLGDEVYEHILYTGQHESLARMPELRERSFVVSSFGKTYHITGWKVAYCLAPAALTAEFRKVHQLTCSPCITRRNWGWPISCAPIRASRPGSPTSTGPSATSSACSWRARASSCCPVTAPTSSSRAMTGSTICPTPSSRAG